jgi:hypothetical protein
MKARTLHTLCFSVLLGILFLPLLQEKTGLFKEKPLAGVEDKTDSIPLTDSTWFSGKFQENYAVRMYQWMGLRPSMVRLRNQLDYSLFNEPYRSVLVGKNNELFGRGSMATLEGEDFVGWPAVQYQAERTLAVQSLLAQRGVAMITVITPSKLQCMPEYLPGEELHFPADGNYPAFTRTLKQQGVYLIDFAPVLIQWMHTEKERIFPRTGTHWTDYAATLAADSMVAYLEKLMGRPFVRPQIAGMETSTEMRGTDADAGDLLNLMWDLEPAPIGYPKLQYKTEGRTRPRALVIGDSFWWKIYNQGIHRNVFAPGSQYRYYNYEVFSDQWEDAKIIHELDFAQTLANVDVVILCVNVDNLHRYPFGFLDQVMGVGMDN